MHKRGFHILRRAHKVSQEKLVITYISYIYIAGSIDWLYADSSALLEQMGNVEMKLKEKKIKSFREKFKKQQEIKNRQLVKTFVKQHCTYRQQGTGVLPGDSTIIWYSSKHGINVVYVNLFSAVLSLILTNNNQVAWNHLWRTSTCSRVSARDDSTSLVCW